MNSSLKSMCLALSLCASTILCDNSGQPSSWKSLFSGWSLPSASSYSSFVTGLQGRTQSLFASVRVKYNEPLLAKDGENTRLTKGNVFLGASLFFGATGLIGWNIWRYRKKALQKATDQSSDPRGPVSADSTLHTTLNNIEKVEHADRRQPEDSNPEREPLLDSEYEKNVAEYWQQIEELTRLYKLTEKGKRELFSSLRRESNPFSGIYMDKFDNARTRIL